MRVVLINPPLKSVVCEYGVGGYQMPHGLLMVGGPLIDAGHEVKLIDAACDRLTDEQIVQRVTAFDADVVMTGHIGSTQAHPCSLRMLRAIKTVLSHVVTVYGGVHPTYHYDVILSEHPEVDVIVRGEGEAMALELINVLSHHRRTRLRAPLDLSCVQSIAYRQSGNVTVTPPRAPIHDLDVYRIGWELVKDWDRYQAFGLGRAAVVQFSRGCPHTCTYCGQWMFWKRWRHRDVMKFVDELEWLARERDVRFFWLADENPAAALRTCATSMRPASCCR